MSFEPDCPFANECEDKGILCGSCKNNKSKKKTHYEPEPWFPRPRPIDIYPIKYWCYC